MPADRDRYRSFRRHWWFRPMVLLPAAGLLLLSVPMVWWISTYKSVAAVVMFVITYVSMLVIVVRMMRPTISEPDIRLNEQALKDDRAALARHRLEHRAAVGATELDLLRKGEPTPVLDVWRLDRSMSGRHSFIDDIRTCRILPDAAELHVRVHLEDSWTDDVLRTRQALLLREVASFLRLVAEDASAAQLRPFYRTLVLELYQLREDAGFAGTPVPVLSLEVRRVDLARASAETRPPFIPGELRFADGAEVEPHRRIPPSSGAGSK